MGGWIDSGKMKDRFAVELQDYFTNVLLVLLSELGGLHNLAADGSKPSRIFVS